MGGEKFFNIKCYYSGLRPSCAVVVCTVRALKLHSNEAPKVVAGAALAKEYTGENLPLVRKGAVNLLAHIRNVTNHGTCHRRSKPGPFGHACAAKVSHIRSLIVVPGRGACSGGYQSVSYRHRC